MAIICFGSLNIDHVYQVKDFVRPGETLACHKYQKFGGGKGLNQSIALARAGAKVYHAGKIGPDGLWLKELLEKDGVDTKYINCLDTASGHAIIQVSQSGENSIIIHGGANRMVTAEDARQVFADFGRGDSVLLQNEISSIKEIINLASELSLKIIFNPAPMNQSVRGYPLNLVNVFILNEIEGRKMSRQSEPDSIVASLLKSYPNASVVLTLGERGVLYADKQNKFRAPAEKVTVKDTTAAGDTFIGYFLANLGANRDIEQALAAACKASAICVTRDGAAESIPHKQELETES